MEQTILSATVPNTDSLNDPAARGFWNEYIDERAAAEFAGVSRRTLQGWRYRGGGPRYFRLSAKLVRYRRIDLHEHAEKCARTSTSDGGQRDGA